MAENGGNDRPAASRNRRSGTRRSRKLSNPCQRNHRMVRADAGVPPSLAKGTRQAESSQHNATEAAIPCLRYPLPRRPARTTGPCLAPCNSGASRRPQDAYSRAAANTTTRLAITAHLALGTVAGAAARARRQYPGRARGRRTLDRLVANDTHKAIGTGELGTRRGHPRSRSSLACIV